MRRLAPLIALLALTNTNPHQAAPPPVKPASGFESVTRSALDVTDGKVGETRDGYLTIDSPAVRAVQRVAGATAGRLEFTYHGPSKEISKLASGRVVHQIGLKLRAKNTCNLLYVMWRLEEQEHVVVQVKSNPGLCTHAECGGRGYVNIKPAFQVKPDQFPSARDGKPHTLEAKMSKAAAADYELVVTADGTVVWNGSIDAKLLDPIDGPAGFRTDNGVFTFKFFTLAR